jgi:hypothetical protein
MAGMKRLLLPLALVVAFIAIAVVGTLHQRPARALTIDCADPVKGCAFVHRGTPAHLHFSQLPMPLKPFRLDVLAPGTRTVGAEVEMAGMNMGFNRYALGKRMPGLFSTEITLSVCVSGEHDWKLYLDLDGQRYVVPFRTG